MNSQKLKPSAAKYFNDSCMDDKRSLLIPAINTVSLLFKTPLTIINESWLFRLYPTIKSFCAVSKSIRALPFFSRITVNGVLGLSFHLAEPGPCNNPPLNTLTPLNQPVFASALCCSVMIVPERQSAVLSSKSSKQPDARTAPTFLLISKPPAKISNGQAARGINSGLLMKKFATVIP